jgi:hypothetical protein
MMNLWVQAFQFDASISGSELPVNFDDLAVAFLFPSGHFRGEHRFVRYTAVETLPSKHAEFDFGHVEPTTMFGRVMELEAMGQAVCLSWREGFVEGSSIVGVKVVQHNDDGFGVWIPDVGQFSHSYCPVPARSPVSNTDMTLASQWLKKHEKIGDTLALVLIIDPYRLSRGHGQWLTRIIQQLFVRLVHTNQWLIRVIGASIDIQHILHVTDKFGAGFGWDAPLHLQPRLKLIFFSVWRTVSWDTLSTISSSTMRSWSKRSVQRPRPSGGAPHANATRCASARPSRRVTYSRADCLPMTAASKPCSAYALRTLLTVTSVTSNASQIWAYGHFAPASLVSDFSNIRARVNVRARSLPVVNIFSNCSRSLSDNLTMYF